MRRLVISSAPIWDVGCLIKIKGGVVMKKRMGIWLLSCLVHVPVSAVSLRASIALANVATLDMCLTSKVKC